MSKVCPHCRTEYDDAQLTCPNDGAELTLRNAEHDPLLGQVLADRYRVIRVLGEGGMGRVYLAEHVRMGRMSAVKVMSPALVPTADAIGRFNREAANASRINHPNVVSIYDFGEASDGTLYLAMEYVEGETLSSLIRRDGPLTLARTADFVRQIAAALNAAHQLGIVHRDLKPDNMLITRDPDGNDLVKVVDFGIAKSMRGGGQTLTTVGVSVGTPEFMSPEQLAGQPLDSRSDIYSLGLVAFMLLTCQFAHPDVTSKQSLVRRLTARPKSLRDVQPEILWPARLQSALDRAMSPEPEDRYARVTDFAIDVMAATSLDTSVEGDLAPAMTTPTVMAEPEVGTRALPPAAPTTRLRQGSWMRSPTFAVVSAVGALAAVAIIVAMVTIPRGKGGFMRSPESPVDTVLARVVAGIQPPGRPSALPSAGRPVGAQATQRSRVPTTTRATAPAAGPAASSRIDAEALEVMRHARRARLLYTQGKAKLAGMQLQRAVKLYGEFAKKYPDSPELQQLRRQLAPMVNEAWGRCGEIQRSLGPGPNEDVCATLELMSRLIAPTG